MNWKRFLSLTVAGAMALAMTGCQSKEEDSSQQDDAAVGVAVQVQQVELSSIATDNNVSGKVAADSQTSIMVAAAAKCTAVYVEAGDEVKAGDKICTLDLASTIAAYNAAKITYDSTVNSYADQKAVLDKQIALYEKNLKDTKALFDIGAASQAEIDQAELTLMGAKNQRETALSQLEAGMQSYKSNVQQLDQVLQDVDSKGNVIAPVSGTLVSLSATENGYVSASMPVAVINGTEQMKITVSVSEALVPKLAIGDQADVAVSAAGVLRHCPLCGEGGQYADPAVHRHSVRAGGGVRPAVGYVCRGDLPHGPGRRGDRRALSGRADPGRHPLCLCGGGRHRQVCGGDAGHDGQRRDGGHLRPDRRAAAGDRGPVLSE